MHRASQLNNSYEISRLVTIAPAPNKKEMTLELNGTAMGPKKYTNRSNPYCGAQAASIARRNARERNRVKQVNDSFNALRRRLPAAVVAALSNGSRRGTGKKLSKVDTLRMVVEYIRHMEDLLKESDDSFGYHHQQEENVTSVGVNQMWNNHEDIDEGFICGSSSPYSESLPSPDSDCSSGVSVYSSNVNYFGGSYQPMAEEQLSPVEDNLLETMSWWQHK